MKILIAVTRNMAGNYDFSSEAYSNCYIPTLEVFSVISFSITPLIPPLGPCPISATIAPYNPSIRFSIFIPFRRPKINKKSLSFRGQWNVLAQLACAMFKPWDFGNDGIAGRKGRRGSVRVSISSMRNPMARLSYYVLILWLCIHEYASV